VPDILASGDISGLGGAIANQDGDRTVTAGYAEFAIPVTNNLNVDLSTRVDHYDDLKADNTPWTGKGSVTWQPWQWGMFRASYGTGFRAPTLGELHGPVILATSEQFIDPLFADQGPIQANAFIGGNPDLKPEKSKQSSVGFVWTPVRNFTGRVDYWEIKIDKYITTPSALAMVNAARAGSFIFTPGEVSFLPDGEVDTVNEVSQNAAKAHFSGIDGAASWRQPTAWGTWGVDYAGTYYLKADLDTGSSTEKNVGTIVDPNTLIPLQLPIGGGVIVRYKQTVSLNWNFGPWGATVSNNYITGYETAPNQVDGAAHFVPSFNTWDVQGTYTGFNHVQLTLGARNAFDKQPNLYIPTNGQFQYGYDSSIYDPRGRVVYGRIVVAF
jgi:iron complex outermembrane receptor protein